MLIFEPNTSMLRQAKRNTNSLGIRDDNYCSVVAVALAFDIGYMAAYNILSSLGREHRKATPKSVVHDCMTYAKAEWVWILEPTTIKEFVQQHLEGRYYVSIQQGDEYSHACAVVDGIVLDNEFDSGTMVLSAWKIN